MSYEIIWPDVALAQVKAIYDYVKELASEASAEKLANELLDATEPLAENPRLYPVFPGSIERARHIVVRREWRVLYQVDDISRRCIVLDVVGTRLVNFPHSS